LVSLLCKRSIPLEVPLHPSSGIPVSVAQVFEIENISPHLPIVAIHIRIDDKDVADYAILAESRVLQRQRILNIFIRSD
jgi:hypothetical protein